MITRRQKKYFIRKEKEAIRMYKKAGLKGLMNGEKEDLARVKRIKVK